MRRILLTALLATAAACDRGSEAAPPEVLAARREAARHACIANELLRGAQDQLQTLQSALPAEGDPGAALARAAAAAATEFARAYLQHAELRAAAYAQLDSAANAAPRPADSLRHARAADQFSIRVPEAGTLEANVLRAYERDFVELRGDADHPCNWELEEEGTGP